MTRINPAFLRKVSSLRDEAFAPGSTPSRERFTGERLDRIAFDKSMQPIAGELREASLTWIEHNIERRLITRELLEQTES